MHWQHFLIAFIPLFFILGKSSVHEEATLWHVGEDASVNQLFTVEFNPSVVGDDQNYTGPLIVPIGNSVSLRCDVNPGHSLPADESFPRVGTHIFLVGNCNDGWSIEFNSIADDSESMNSILSAGPGNLLFVDYIPGSGNKYAVYSSDESDLFSELYSTTETETSQEDISTSTYDVDVNGEIFENYSIQSYPSENIVHHTFRIALSTTFEYSEFHGNTVESVLNEINRLISRLNIILSGELGISFTVIANTSRLICIRGVSDSRCNTIFNEPPALFENLRFMNSMGVTEDQYDIAHILGTYGGGSAATGLCSTGYKSGAYTGTHDPRAETSFIEFMLHEVGHQLNASHAFKDCGSSEANNHASIEPGSGSTIMSYAGICHASKNLQERPTIFYNSYSLIQMKTFIQKAITENPDCGTAQELQIIRPILQAPDSVTIPSGNYFYLKGQSTDSSMYFSWESIDPGPESYENPAIARFRTWIPRKSTLHRYFPNLYYITNGLTDGQQLFEIVPSSKNQSILFRFVGRLILSDTDDGEAQTGDFNFAETIVDFNTDYAPLRLDCPGQIEPLTLKTFSWTTNELTRSLAPTVHLYFLFTSLPPQLSFVYDRHESDSFYTWYPLALNLPNNGSVEVSIPQFREYTQIPVTIVLRSDGDDAFFFDTCFKATLTAKSGARTVEQFEIFIPPQDIEARVLIYVAIGIAAFSFLVGLSVFIYFRYRKVRKSTGKVDDVKSPS